MPARMKLSTRILSLAVITVVCFMIALTFIYTRFSSKMYDAKYVKTRNLVESAWGVLDYYAGQAKQGAISADEAKRLAKEVVKKLRYEKDDYYWINDMGPAMVMHPFKPELDGKDLSSNADPNGKKLFVAMVEVCKKEGQGFVDYYWPKPGEPKPAPKISYVKSFPEWGWIIGSGIYIDDVRKEIQQVTTIVGGIVLLITLGVLVLAYLMSRSISGPIYEVAMGLEEIVTEVTAASTELQESSQALAESASEQAASIEETTAALEEMASMSQETAGLTVGANQLMNENIEKSGQSLKALVELTRNMSQIEADSDRISQIIKTIDEIAFQTNLLALNAAVEAARAGEAGAGFAVVADEVRNLAMRATEAAQSTQHLLQNTVQRVSEAAQSIKFMNTAFEGIVESATVMGEKTAAITAVSKEQAVGIDQISKAAHGIDTTTQQVADSASTSASAAEVLTEQISKMKVSVDALAHIVGGSDAMAITRGGGKNRKTGPGKGAGMDRAPRRTFSLKARIKKREPVKRPALRSGEVGSREIVPMSEKDFEDF